MAFKTAEQIEANKQDRLVRDADAAVAEHAKRSELSSKKVTITLTARPDVRSAGAGLNGHTIVHFRGAEANRNNALSAVYFLADHERSDGFGEEEFSQRVESLEAGDQLSLAGKWSKRKWKGQDGKDRESWEFQAQRFERGDVSLWDMERAAHARLAVGLKAIGLSETSLGWPAAEANDGREEARARQRAAMLGAAPEPQQAGNEPARTWTEQELIAAIPDLFTPTKGYKAYSGIGSRETPQDVCDDMTAVARVLEARGLTGRSGAADKADTAFEKGAMETGDRFETYLPWASFDKRPAEMIGRKAKPILMDRATEARAREIASRFHPAWDALRRDGTPVLTDGMKALHTRNVPQVLGKDLNTPVAAVLCYTVDGEASGGTGQAMRMSASFGLPILNFHNPRIRAAILTELGLGIQRDAALDREAAEKAAMSREAMQEAMQQEAVRGANQVPGQFDLRAPEPRFIQDSDAAPFCKVKDDRGDFSNMSNSHPIRVDGVTWRSTEALFQAARFPHRPDIQRKVWAAHNAYAAKVTAYEHIAESREDWNSELPGGGKLKDHMMAFALTQKLQSPAFAALLAENRGKAIVEISSRDQYWGATKVAGGYRGQNQLGSLLDQLNAGARMDTLPPGTTFPCREYLEGKEAAHDLSEERTLPEPAIKASMYFAFAGQKRSGIASDTTFEAINAGERTSTTRFQAWGGYDRWKTLTPGDVVRFYADREMRGEKIDVVVLGVREVDLRSMPSDQLEEWSKAEGWSPQAGRDFGGKYGVGLQVRYDLPQNVDADRIAKAREEQRAQTHARGEGAEAPARLSLADPAAERRHLQRQAMGIGL